MLHTWRVHRTHSGTRKHDVRSGYLQCEELLCMYMCCADWVYTCMLVCVYRGTQRALAMRLFTRVWEVSARALGPPRPISAVEFVQVSPALLPLRIGDGFEVLSHFPSTFSAWLAPARAFHGSHPASYRFEDRDICRFHRSSSSFADPFTRVRGSTVLCSVYLRYVRVT